MDKIKKDGHLASKDFHTLGQVRVTVNSGIVFFEHQQTRIRA
jgi:hypothetical protein